VTAALLTEATVTPMQAVLGLAALGLAGVPLLFIPPEGFPAWLDGVSLALPTRAGRDLVIAATTGADLPDTALPVLVLWTLVAGAVAVWAYRRDEGRRFR